MAHKLSGAGSGIFGFTKFPSPRRGSACPSSHGQHDSGFIYQPPRRNPLAPASKAGGAPPLMGGQTPAIDPGSACSRCSELWRGHAVQGRPDQRRVETTSTDGAADLEPVRGSGDRSVCLSGERALPAVFLADGCSLGGRCSVESLASRSEVCLSPTENYAASAAQGQGREGDFVAGSAEMAQPALVPGADGDDNGSPVADSSAERSPVSSRRLGVAPQTRALEPACLAVQRERRELTVSRWVLDTIDEARAPSTRHLYDLKWRVFIS